MGKYLNERQATGLRLSKGSPEEQVKQYFMAIMELSKLSEEFPINLDDVWPLVYSRRQEAVRALIMNDSLFVEGVDYQILRKNAQQDSCIEDAENGKQDIKKWGGNNKVEYYLSVPCLEYLIVRKVRPVFEVYRQVFHRVANGGVILFGDNKYYTLSEYCRMFEKTANSFYGLMAAYREEFAMIGRTFYISKALCRMIEMRCQVERVRRTIKEKSDKAQLELEFKEAM